MKYDLIINSDSNVIKLHVCDCFRKYDFVTIGRKMKIRQNTYKISHTKHIYHKSTQNITNSLQIIV
jgi:hypothetical protein